MLKINFNRKSKGKIQEHVFAYHLSNRLKQCMILISKLIMGGK